MQTGTAKAAITGTFYLAFAKYHTISYNNNNNCYKYYYYYHSHLYLIMISLYHRNSAAGMAYKYIKNKRKEGSIEKSRTGKRGEQVIQGRKQMGGTDEI